ncbi:MAG TPA: hypothetical protein VNP94_05145 [Actinomycetota bacterium]|nr:hypothetical protein [Actinomycetota bacterium]
MARALGFLWTLPNTVLGLVLGLLTFQRPRLVRGVVAFDRAERGLTWVLRRLDRTAMTVGHVVVSARPLEGALLEHELHHVRQYRAWGPLFIPAYLLLAAVFGYRRHPFERAAMRAAGEVGGPAAGGELGGPGAGGELGGRGPSPPGSGPA